MRRAETGARTAGLKAPKTVDEYLASVPAPNRRLLRKLRETIRSVVPSGSLEVLSYGMPAFKHKKPIVWYAAFSDHCSLFPTPAVIVKFKKELAGFSTSKGTIQFTVDKPIPAVLVKKMVKARLAELEG